MSVCLNCGKETIGCLCDECRGSVDTEQLCRSIIEYRIGSEENPLWERAAAGMEHVTDFRHAAFEAAETLPLPRREYWQIMSLAGTGANVPKANRAWLYEAWEKIRDTEGLSPAESDRVKGIMLGALFMDYRYEEADRLASELLEEEKLPVQAYYNLADFFTKTRRYDEADDVIAAVTSLYGDDEAKTRLGKLAEDNRKYRDKEAAGKQQYMPRPAENKDEVQKAYVDFLAGLGIDAEVPKKSSVPKAIPIDEYPAPKVIRNADFDTFVAYDLETTGLSSKIDAIIEIGAVKVVGGHVVESQEFVFQEFVRPYKKSLHEDIAKLTGISAEDVKGARQMWEVFPDFMKFVGDCVMVGFNNEAFDSKFLARAGRYSHIIMENPQFDVMRYAERFKKDLGSTDVRSSLEALSRRLGIENPKAHRALADAITTARVFLKLKEMEKTCS